MGMALLGLLFPLCSAADDNIPKADLLDVEFLEDGTAVDQSPRENVAQVVGQENLTM